VWGVGRLAGRHNVTPQAHYRSRATLTTLIGVQVTGQIAP
jgi:hypothetical protein